jgi:hypothetical protein
MPIEVQQGFEADRVMLGDDHERHDVRWWLYLHVTGDDARRQASRLGVADAGFRFARGGRARSFDDAAGELDAARHEALRDLQGWRGQPSHMLNASGGLVPLDEVRAELLA